MRRQTSLRLPIFVGNLIGAPAIIAQPIHESLPLTLGSQASKEIRDSGIGDHIVDQVGLWTVQASIELSAEVSNGVGDCVCRDCL